MQLTIYLTLVPLILFVSNINSLPSDVSTDTKIDSSKTSESSPDVKDSEAVNSFLLKSMKQLLERDRVTKKLSNAKQATQPDSPAKPLNLPNQPDPSNPISSSQLNLIIQTVVTKSLTNKMLLIEERLKQLETVTSGGYAVANQNNQNGGSNHPIVIEILPMPEDGVSTTYAVSPNQPSINGAPAVPLSPVGNRRFAYNYHHRN